ncbi:MAG: hypothetical protein ACOX50_04195 [Patescibacteria group bacterium]|jgi:hypothetical protein
MKTKNQKPTRLLLPLLAFIFLVVVGVGYFVINPKIQEIRKFEEIKELTEKTSDPAYAKHGSQERDDIRKRLCLLMARPANEREQAIEVIRDFLDKPTIEVKYACSDAFYSLDEDKLIPAKSETYTAGFDYFLVNPATNHIVEYGEQGDTWGYKEDGSRWFSERKQVDYTKRYSQKELEEIATKFIQDKLSPLGITEFDHYKVETQTKNGTTYFFRWLLDGCSYGKDCKFFELVYSAGGDLLRYDSNLEGEGGRVTSP